MWGPLVSLMAGGKTEIVSIIADAYIGDLWAYVGSPSGPVDVQFMVDNADAAAISISLNFHSESTFTFVAVNGGRFIGTGGAGGGGGDDNGATGTPGVAGGTGGAAITSDTFNINIDIDDGFLLGGGGGGGGGSFNDTGADGTPGGGGGGGIGWGDATGGTAGDTIGTPIADAGTAGSQLAAGMGGDGATVLTNDGGDGSNWGLAGKNGLFANPSVSFFGASGAGNGGSGGNAGSAFNAINGSVATFNGASGEPTLRIQSRIKGETDGVIVIPDETVYSFHLGSGHPSETYGWRFTNTEVLTERNTQAGDSDVTGAWYSGNAITPADYEVRYLSTTHGGLGWDSEPGVADTWYGLGSSRSFLITTAAASRNAVSCFEIRRTDETDACASGLLSAAVEYEP